MPEGAPLPISPPAGYEEKVTTRIPSPQERGLGVAPYKIQTKSYVPSQTNIQEQEKLNQQYERQVNLNEAYKELDKYIQSRGDLKSISYDSSFQSVVDAFAKVGINAKQVKSMYEGYVTSSGEYIQAEEQTTEKTSGYFYNPQTGLGVSTINAPKGYIQTATPTEIRTGQLTQRAGLVFGQNTISNFTFQQTQQAQTQDISLSPKQTLAGDLFGKSVKQSDKEKNVVQKTKDYFKDIISKTQVSYDKDFHVMNIPRYIGVMIEGITPKGLTTDVNKLGLKFETIAGIREEPLSKNLPAPYSYAMGLIPHIAPAGSKPEELPITKKIESFAVVSAFTGLFAPVISNTRATTRLQEGEFRVAPLAPKQPPRTVGLDISKQGKNAFTFTEEIVIPKRMQRVSTPVLDYFGYSYKKVYTPEVRYKQSSAPLIYYNQEGKFVGATKFSDIKNPRVQTANLIYGQAKVTQFPERQLNSKAQQKQLDILMKEQSIKLKRGQEQTSYLKEGQEFFVSDVTNVKLGTLKLSKSPTQDIYTFRKTPEGKRINRANILGVQVKVFESPTKEIYGYKFTSRDTTFPTSRPRRYPTTKGVSIVLKPSEPVTSDFFGTGNKGLKSETSKSISPEIIQKQISQSAIKGIPQPKPTDLKGTQISKQEDIPSIIIIPKTPSVQETKQKELLSQTSQTKQEQRQEVRIVSMPKEVVRSYTPSRLDTPSRESNKTNEVFRYGSGLKETQATKQVQEQVSIITRITPRVKPPPTPPRPKRPDEPIRIIEDISMGKEEEPTKLTWGFIPEVKVRGRFRALSKPVSKGRALEIGAGYTERTLSQTFRLRPTRVKVKQERFREPSILGKFRQFIQRRGTRRYTPNQYIEKKKYALEPSEQRIIKPLSRRSRTGSMFGI